ncbi:MAG: hypothetical protein NT038_08005 [Euryarchaeota archaeon]|nr:hypothetical protein [Euryarchaeota archaeon]
MVDTTSLNQLAIDIKNREANKLKLLEKISSREGLNCSIGKNHADTISSFKEGDNPEMFLDTMNNALSLNRTNISTVLDKVIVKAKDGILSDETHKDLILLNYLCSKDSNSNNEEIFILNKSKDGCKDCKDVPNDGIVKTKLGYILKEY